VIFHLAIIPVVRSPPVRCNRKFKLPVLDNGLTVINVHGRWTRINRWVCAPRRRLLSSWNSNFSVDVDIIRIIVKTTPRHVFFFFF
jgi:hypothetical protein